MRRVIGVVLGAVFLAVVVWQSLPALFKALPGAVQHRVPAKIQAQIITPLPTALPAPLSAQPPPRITLPPIEESVGAAAQGSEGADGLSEIALTPSPLPLIPPSPLPATPFPTRRPTATPLPTAVTLTGLTNVPQKFNNCGPTNLSLTLAYHGFAVDQLAIAAVLKPNGDDRNVSPEELAGYVIDETPLRAAVYRGGDLVLLKRFISAGFPVIVEKGLFPSEWEGWMGHYLTVYGYDDLAQVFTSMDTFLGPWDGGGHGDSYATMAEYWLQFNHAFILVYRPDQEPEIRQILGANLLDGRAMWRRAVQKAQVEIEANPDNAYAWFNLGSSLARLAGLTGQEDLWQSAAAAFDQARIIGLPRRMLWYQFEPYQAYLAVGRTADVLALAEATLASEGGQNVEETYYYQGLAFRAAGEMAAAKAAFARARQLNPHSLLTLPEN